jgi:glutathione S-transferase
MLALGYESMSVPAVKVGDRRVQGSRWIARALDEIVPERPLFPADPRLRRLVEEAERWGELLNDATRRLFYCAARRDPGVFEDAMSVGSGRSMRLALHVGAPALVRLAGGAHHASDSAGREDLMMLPQRLGQIDAWIEEGVLGGDELNAADFQIAPNVASLLLSEDLWPHVEGRPAAALARRVLPCKPGRRLRLAPPEWLLDEPHGHAGQAGPGTAGDFERPAVVRPSPIPRRVARLLVRSALPG